MYEKSVFRYRNICVHIFENLNFQKRVAERGAATMRATLASEGEINSKIGIKSVIDTPDACCKYMQCSRTAHPFPPPFFEHSGGCGMPLANLYLRFYGIFAIWGAAYELQRLIARLSPPFPPLFFTPS